MLILLRGVSGSGKSTLAQILTSFNSNSVAIAADDYFLQNAEREYRFDARKLFAAHNGAKIWLSGI